jgi:uncharacterized membrane protein
MIRSHTAMPGDGSSAEARRSRGGVWLAGLLALLFLSGTLAPAALDHGGAPGGAVIQRVYSSLCHQIPQRSLALGSGVQAVCARCCGLYLGGVLGLFCAAGWIVGRRRSPRPAWLAWALAPTLVDAALPWVGLAGLENLPRLLLAVPAGLVAGLFLAIGIHDLLSSSLRNPA